MSGVGKEHKKPAYRASRKEVAVKAYTLNQESRHLRVENVNPQSDPEELVRQFALYGEIEAWKQLEDKEDPYTDVYLISFKEIQHARFARRKLHKSSFVGLDLRVTYACEMESMEDVRAKISERREVVRRKLANWQEVDARKDQKAKGPKTTARVWDESTISREEWLQQGGNPLLLPAAQAAQPIPAAKVVSSVPPTAPTRQAASPYRTAEEEMMQHPYYYAATSSDPNLPQQQHHHYGMSPGMSQQDYYNAYYAAYYAQYYPGYAASYPQYHQQAYPPNASSSSPATTVASNTGDGAEEATGKKRKAEEPPETDQDRSKVAKTS